MSQSRGVSPQFDRPPSAASLATAAIAKRLRGLSKLPATALGNNKLSHSTSSLASHIRSGSDLGGYSTKLSENLLQIFHPQSGQQPGVPHQHPTHQQPIKTNKITSPLQSNVSPLKSQTSDPTTGLGLQLRPKILSKSATTSSIVFPTKRMIPTQQQASTSTLQFNISSQLAIGRYKEFLKLPQTPHKLKRIWSFERNPQGNRPKYYQSLLSGKFPLSPRFAKRGRRKRKANPFKEYRRLNTATQRKYQGKWNSLLMKPSGMRQESSSSKLNEGPSKAKSNPPSFMSRQNSNEDYGGHSTGNSVENIYGQFRSVSRRGNKSNLSPAMKQKYPTMNKSMFGGSCGNIYEKSKRHGSGFDHPSALYSTTYNNTIIGLESLKPRKGAASGYKSPKVILGIGDFDLPAVDLQTIRDDDGFSDVGFEGTFEEDGDTEDECTMDFDSESISSQSSVEVSGVNEYRYRTSRPLTQNPLYISNSYSSSCSSLEAIKLSNRSKRTKKGYKKQQQQHPIFTLRTDLSSSRRSSGTDMELLLTQKQRQGQFKSLGRVMNLPPKWSVSQGALATPVSMDGRRASSKTKDRRRDKFEVYETLNEELIFFKNNDRGLRSGSSDRFNSSARRKAPRTVPHSRTGSPCSVNSLHLTTRSNTPTQQMHFCPIHPVLGGGGTTRKSRDPVQKVSPFASSVIRSGQRAGGEGAGGGGVGGTSVVNNTLPEQKLSVRIHSLFHSFS